MAFIWLDAEGNGIGVSETVEHVGRLFMDALPGELLRFTHTDNDGPVFIDRDRIFAVEPGHGADDDA